MNFVAYWTSFQSIYTDHKVIVLFYWKVIDILTGTNLMFLYLSPWFLFWTNFWICNFEVPKFCQFIFKSFSGKLQNHIFFEVKKTEPHENLLSRLCSGIVFSDFSLIYEEFSWPFVGFDFELRPYSKSEKVWIEVCIIQMFSEKRIFIEKCPLPTQG